MSSPSPLRVEDCEVHDYAIIDGRPIQFDYWGPTSGSSPRPAIVFFHGGKLITSNRRALVPLWLKQLAYTQNWAFISADYRLLVPATGQDILADVRALFAYIHAKFSTIDHENIVVFGSSAGAYPARLAGLWIEPRPKAIALIYGRSGDFLSPSYLKAPTSWPEAITSNPSVNAAITELLRPSPGSKLRPEWDIVEKDQAQCTPLSATTPGGVRESRILWAAMMAEGVVLDYVTGIPGLGARIREALAKENLDETATSEAREVLLVQQGIVPSQAREVIPQLQLTTPEFKSKPPFPPTYLLHGLEDSHVLPLESQRMYDQLQEQNVSVEVAWVPGEGHCFDWCREEEDGVREPLKAMEDWLIKQVNT
ncbi:alpha/beta-hydrolase [Clavulina sp. PMI_390]|nr:alpha/beta-hydrolase [Clavulina sp. PMI_390]